VSPTEAAQRAAVVAEARTWLNTPYHHRGAIKGVGVDCAMLLIEVYRACGLIPAIDPGHYPPDWMMHRSEERYLGIVEQHATRIDGVPLPGDAAVYQVGRCFSHGAIVIDWPLIVHAYLPQRVVALGDGSSGDLGRRPRYLYRLNVWGSA